MRKYKRHSLRLFFAGALSLGLLLNGCSKHQDQATVTADDLDVSIEEPIERDYADIKEKGVLRVITRYSSNSYFIHQGVEWGFEYELIKEFAEENDLALETIIVSADENPYDLLNSGEGDIIAANYTVTPERSQYVNFTRPYNIVDQVLVFSEAIEDPPETIEEVARRGIPITVRRNSSYYHRLKELQKEGLNLTIHLVPNEKDTESLMFDISNNNYAATVADDNIFQASNKYMSGLTKGPTIASSDSIAWAIRKNSSDLESQLNNFLYKHFRVGEDDQLAKRSTFLNILQKRYFQKGSQIANYYSPEYRPTHEGLISPYDNLLKTVADSAGVDWLMVAAVVAQETRFNPNSKSWAGAVGLLQVIPRFSEVGSEELLYDEEINVREGVRILKEHLDHYAYMDSTNQWSFALAAYNAGSGHVADARRLAIDANKDPNEWEHVSEAFLKLMQRKYYKNARYGFSRGIETVRYVQEIRNRYKTYKSVAAMAENREKHSTPGVLGLFN